jgi:WD40 repeat protein
VIFTLIFIYFQVWDLRTNALLFKLKGHTDTVTGMSVSPDGSYVMSNGMDSSLRIWDVRPYAPQERCVKILQGHQHNFEKVGCISKYLVVTDLYLTDYRICSGVLGPLMALKWLRDRRTDLFTSGTRRLGEFCTSFLATMAA